MAERTAMAFVHDLQTDEALRERVSHAASLEDLTRIAEAAGYSVRVTDLEVAVRHKLERKELDERELDAVTGGVTIQVAVQNVSQTYQLMSNIMKADSDAKLNAIRNMRG
jgi:predicted ribosomally synthesized peptide with nif11-like leader